MKYIADSCFFQGASHAVCEDYARSGITPDGRPYAIVSDGCSSSTDTDFGARFLARAAELRILDSPSVFTAESVAWQARSMCLAAGLHPKCLDATLLWIEKVPNGLRAVMNGDGIIGAKPRDGKDLVLWKVEYTFDNPTATERVGAPAYPSYHLEANRKKDYHKQTRRGTRQIQCNAEKGYPDPNICLQRLLDGFDPYSKIFSEDYYEFVFIATDGGGSFQQKEDAHLPSSVAHDIVIPCMLEKVAAGREGSLTRRCNRFLKHEAPILGWFHYDDFAIGGIWSLKE
jgi:hypothetical protein